ncbi:hypothetical protein [Macrococcoides bohemicum]|uniref:hypothetical protein n=1 Tax=Macrococcoides bohemicum TaxID=1903056 RepID=UPI00165E5B8A|nr:hypothetical protein [Macrococcus bohemicus]MBC9875612.1 hypothetical protein [Macrococcus bohemicus]
MKKYNGIGELVSNQVLVDHDWFMPSTDSLGHYQFYRVLKVVSNNRIVINEDVPYGSSNTRDMKSIINNYNKLKETIENRLNKKNISKEKLLFKATVNFNYGTRIKYESYSNNLDIVSEIIEKGYVVHEVADKLIIITDSIDILIEQFKEKLIFDSYFFEITEKNQFTITRQGVSNNGDKVIISPSTRNDVKYQITLFKKDLPYGHLNIKSDEELNYWIDTLEVELTN